MFRTRLSQAAFLLCASVSLLACVTDADESTIAREETIASQVFTGKVVDGQGAPISGARVTINGISRITGTAGTYAVSVADAPRYNIDIRKNGFGPLTERHTAGRQSATHRMVAGVTRTIDPKKDNVITDDASGIRVNIPASALRGASGTPVGNVRFTIIPHTAQTMPGDFTAVRPDGTRVGLVSVGAVTLQAEDSAGNTLVVAPNAQLNVRLPVPASAGAKMPDCVLSGRCRAAMWLFDPATALWVEQPAAPAALDPVATNFPVRGREQVIDPANGIGTWNADVDLGPLTACTIIRFNNIPLACYNPMGLPDEPGIGVTFNTTFPAPHTKTSSVRSSAVFVVLYNLAPTQLLTLDFAFPAGAPAACNDNLMLSSNNTVSVTPPQIVVDTGAPWGAGEPPLPFSQCSTTVVAEHP